MSRVMCQESCAKSHVSRIMCQKSQASRGVKSLESALHYNAVHPRKVPHDVSMCIPGRGITCRGYGPDGWGWCANETVVVNSRAGGAFGSPETHCEVCGAGKGNSSSSVLESSVLERSGAVGDHYDVVVAEEKEEEAPSDESLLQMWFAKSLTLPPAGERCAGESLLESDRGFLPSLEDMKKAAQNAAKKAKDVANKAKDAAEDAAKKAGKGLGDLAKKGADAAKHAADAAKEGMKKAGQGLGNLFSKRCSKEGCWCETPKKECEAASSLSSLLENAWCPSPVSVLEKGFVGDLAKKAAEAAKHAAEAAKKAAEGAANKVKGAFKPKCTSKCDEGLKCIVKKGVKHGICTVNIPTGEEGGWCYTKADKCGNMAAAAFSMLQVEAMQTWRIPGV